MAHECTPPVARRAVHQDAAAQRAVEALARELHNSSCEHPWESTTFPTRAAWERHARHVLRGHIGGE